MMIIVIIIVYFLFSLALFSLHLGEPKPLLCFFAPSFLFSSIFFLRKCGKPPKSRSYSKRHLDEKSLLREVIKKGSLLFVVCGRNAKNIIIIYSKEFYFWKCCNVFLFCFSFKLGILFRSLTWENNMEFLYIINSSQMRQIRCSFCSCS